MEGCFGCISLTSLHLYMRCQVLFLLVSSMFDKSFCFIIYMLFWFPVMQVHGPATTRVHAMPCTRFFLGRVCCSFAAHQPLMLLQQGTMHSAQKKFADMVAGIGAGIDAGIGVGMPHTYRRVYRCLYRRLYRRPYRRYDTDVYTEAHTDAAGISNMSICAGMSLGMRLMCCSDP